MSHRYVRVLLLLSFILDTMLIFIQEKLQFICLESGETRICSLLDA